MLNFNILCINFTTYYPYIWAIGVLIVAVILSAICAAHKSFIRKVHSFIFRNVNFCLNNDCTTVKDLFSMFRFLPAIVIVFLMISFVGSIFNSSFRSIWHFFKIINDILPICPIWISTFYWFKDHKIKDDNRKRYHPIIECILLGLITIIFMFSIIDN